jgi:hypothetical protein
MQASKTNSSGAASLCGMLGMISIGLCLYCTIQVPVQKIQTPDAIRKSGALIDISGLDQKKKSELDFYVGQILYNDEVSLATHKNIWPASTMGFLLIGVGNILLAYMLRKDSTQTFIDV